ncbi:MAG: hypothetical protein ABIH46_00080 [Chloroflexota bacterium]
MVTVCTREFEGLGRGQAKLMGMPDLPLVIVPHPVGGQPKAIVERYANDIVEQAAAVLTFRAAKQDVLA